jgi:hypothetical protein
MVIVCWELDLCRAVASIIYNSYDVLKVYRTTAIHQRSTEQNPCKIPALHELRYVTVWYLQDSEQRITAHMGSPIERPLCSYGRDLVQSLVICDHQEN